jgi:hypothetical protein
MDWEDTKRAIQYIFLRSDHVTPETNTKFHGAQLFDGKFDPRMHVENCIKQWKVVQVPSRLWVHLFFHSLGVIPKTGYIHEETRRQTSCWKILEDIFCRDFSFTGMPSELHLVLQIIHEILFTDVCKYISSPIVCFDHSHLV